MLGTALGRPWSVAFKIIKNQMNKPRHTLDFLSVAANSFAALAFFASPVWADNTSAANAFPITVPHTIPGTTPVVSEVTPQAVDATTNRQRWYAINPIPGVRYCFQIESTAGLYVGLWSNLSLDYNSKIFTDKAVPSSGGCTLTENWLCRTGTNTCYLGVWSLTDLFSENSYGSATITVRYWINMVRDVSDAYPENGTLGDEYLKDGGITHLPVPTATAIQHGPHTLDLPSSDDSDWYQVFLTKGHKYRFALNGTSTGKWSISLFTPDTDPSGWTNIYNDQGPSGGMARPPALNYTAPASGIYKLRVAIDTSFLTDGNAAASYKLIYSDISYPFPPVVTGAYVSAVYGVAFSYQPRATTPFNYTLVGRLPAGLRFNPVNGSITGTPTARGAYTVVISVHNGSGIDNDTVTISVR